MRKFTKLWQLLMILLISSSVLVAQAQKDVSSGKANAKSEQKKIDQKSGFTEEQIAVLEKQGINEDMLKDAEAEKKAEEILMMNEMLNPFSVNKGDYPSDAASGYTFGQSSGAYTPITGGTVVASSAPGTGLFLDDNSYAAQPIPFTFVFNGASYTDFTVNTNGFVSFGTTIPAGATYSPISGTTAYAGCISAFSRDCDGRFTFQATTTLGSPVLTAVSHFGGIEVGEEVTATNIPTGATILSFDAGAQTITLSANATATATLHACIAYSAQIRTETLGTTPNRIHVIQFKNFKRYGTTYYGELYNCQIRLYETSNLAEVVYGNYVGNATSTTGQVGLRGATNTDYNNRTTTTNWAATTAGTLNTAACTMSSTVYPASGLTFTWTPPITPGEAYNPSPANLATAVLISTNLGWNFGANTTTYDLLFGTVNPPVTVVVSNGAAVNPGSYDPPANLLYSTTYYWQVVTKGPGGTTNGPVWSFTTSTNLPYPPTNPNPATLATGVSVNADLSWTFGINTDTYDLYFGTVTPPVTKVVDNAAAGATGTYDPGTMSYSTTYYWQVVARNAAKAETPGPIWSFTTECGPIVTLPWTENFDAVVIPALPICWLKENGDWATTNNLNSTYDADAYSGTQFLRESWSATNEYVWTPGFTLNVGTSYDFSFYWAGDTYAGWTGDIFYNTVQNSAGATQMGTSFVVDATVTTKTYAQVARTIVPDATQTYYFAIRVNCPTSAPWYLSFDDFRVEPSPQCPNPQSLGATAISGNSADLTWTSFSGLSDIEFGLYGFIPTGVPTDVGKTSPYTKSPLLPSTQYSFYVRDNCGGGLYSNWVGPYSFYTACATFTAPFVEHFQNQTIPLCWETSGPQLWIFTNTWPDYGADLVTDHTGTGGSFAGVDGSGSTSLTGITLLTPLIDVSPLTDPALRFYIFNNNTNTGATDWQDLSVDLWDGDSWNNSIYYWGPANNDPDWVEVIVALSPYTIVGDIQIRFVVAKSASSPFYDDMIIDDVYVEEAPACPNPSNLGAINITTSQADLTWVSPSGLSDIEFGPSGFTPTGTPTDVGKTSPYTKGGLTASTCYDFYVRDNCGGGEYSNWVGPYTFCTPCDAFTLPYCNSFDAATFPLCWTQGYAPAVTSDRWNVNTTNLAGGIANEMHATWQNVIGESWLTTPVLVVPAGGAILSFKHYYDDYGLGLDLSVRFSNNNGATWTTGWSIASGAGNVGPETLNVPITLSGNVIIQWYMNGNHFQLDNWYVDDVCVIVPLAHDVKTVSVDVPGLIVPGSTLPLATVANNGTNVETFNVTMTITPGTYTSTKTVTALNPGTPIQVTFDAWNAVVGDYSVSVCTQLAGDLDPANDCVAKPVSVQVLRKVYCYVTYDPTAGLPEGPAWFYVQDPGTITSLAATTSSQFISAGAWANDVWYGAEYYDDVALSGGGWWSINPTNGAMNLIADFDQGFTGIAYNNTTNVMYGTDWDAVALTNKLFTIDPLTGVSTLLGTYGTSLMINLACNGTDLYGIGLSDDQMYKIFPTTPPTAVAIGPTGYAFNYAQDMEYDYDNNIMYVAGYTTLGSLYTANLATGACTPIGDFQGGAEITGFAIPYTLGYKVSGNVYYGITGTLKPLATNTTVSLTPHGTTSTGTDGYYELTNVADGNYKLSGSTTKVWGGLQAFDATLVARYLGSIVTFNNLQKRAADVNMTNTITAFDGTLIKRRLGSIATPQWIAPGYVFDGPFPATPALDGLPVTVSGADVTQELRTLCSGDLNSSYGPPVE